MDPNVNSPLNTMPEMRRFATLALITQLVLLLLSLFFYKERMLFLDAPHVLFRIINTQQLKIEEHRYGSFITQSFPLIGSWLHVPLRWLMVLYSASFNLFFLAAGSICYRWGKRYDLTILLALYNTLFVTATFFWPNNEVHQGVAWLMMAFAFFSMGHRHLLWLIISATLFALAIWTHPLVMLPALFLWFFFLFSKQIQVTPFNIGAGIVLIAVAYAKFYQGQHHGYDSGKIELVTELKGDKIKHLLSSPQVRTFVKDCITHYWLFVLLSVAGMASLLHRRAYLLATYTILCSAGYLLLLFITYWEVSDLRFYMESEYMPLTLIACAPFVYYTLPALQLKQGILLLALVFVIKIIYIIAAAQPFRERITWLEMMNSRMKQQQVHKLVVTHIDEQTNKKLLMNWGTPVESIMLSQLQGEKPQRTFIIEDSAQLKTFYTFGRDTLLGCFEKVSAGRINSHYFLLDTTSTYTIE